MRPSGRPAPVRCRTSSRVAPLRAAAWSARPPGASHAGVSAGPGQTALQSTPFPASASATSRESDSIAAFITE
jgi:hypothetical protein